MTQPNIEQSAQDAAVAKATSASSTPRYPGSRTLIRMISEPFDTVDGAQDSLATLSSLSGFVFGFVDDAERRTVTFHVDTHPDHSLPADDSLGRVFSISGTTPF